MRLTGAVALVTGGSSGIGAATARALAGAGARLLIAGRDPARLRAIADQTNGIALAGDLAAPDGPADLADAAQRAAATLPPAPGTGDTMAGIDVLVNNAGVGWAGPIGEITAEKIAELVAVNLTAPMQLTRLLAPGMIARGRGRVVFVSSIAATGVRGEAVYSGTKAGLGSFAESLAYELNGHDVRVSVVVPGVAWNATATCATCRGGCGCPPGCTAPRRGRSARSPPGSATRAKRPTGCEGDPG